MTENLIKNPPFHLQSNLTKVSDLVTTDHPLKNRMGLLKMARVQSVNRRLGQVRVTSGRSKSPNWNSVERSGETVQLPIRNYGINTSGQWFGDFPTVGVGDRVLIAHIDNNASMPIVVGVYPDKNMLRHITPTDDYENVDNNDSHFDDFRASKRVYPSQHVDLHTGTGNYEHSLDGYSVIAALNPGDTTYRSPVWRDDYYTGLPQNSDLGVPMECFKDKYANDMYSIQNKQAQDWLKIHQSHTSSDKHITKRLITQNGHTHNFWGSRAFKTNGIAEDVSPRKYSLRRVSGVSKISGRQNRMHLIKSAEKQIGKHPYSIYTVNTKLPFKEFRKSHLANEIVYEPDPKDKKEYSGSSSVNFIWSILNQNDYSVPKNPVHGWQNTTFMLDKMKRISHKHAKTGDIAVMRIIGKNVYIDGPHKHRAGGTRVSYRYPVFLAQDYHGMRTKVVGDLPFKFHNVVKTTLGTFLREARRYNPYTNFYYHLAYYRMPHRLASSNTFGFDDDNGVRLRSKDANIYGSHHANGIAVGTVGSHIKNNGHTLGLDKSGFKVDGTHLDKIIDQKTKPLKKRIKKLTHSLNVLVYNLNDRHSRLNGRLTMNNVLNLDKKHPTHYHDYDDSSASVPNRQIGYAPSADDIVTAEHYLGDPYKLGGSSLVKGADNSGFVWAVLKHNGNYKVPSTRFNTMQMVSDPASCDLGVISEHTATKGDIFVTNVSLSHSGFLLEDYHGLDTKILNEGGDKDKANISTLGESDTLADAKDYTYLRPELKVPYDKIDDTLPNDNDTLTPIDPGPAQEVGNEVEIDFIRWCNQQGYSINQTAGLLAFVYQASDFGKDTSDYLGADIHEHSVSKYMNRFAREHPSLQEYKSHSDLSAYASGAYFDEHVGHATVSPNQYGQIAQKIVAQIRPHKNVNVPQLKGKALLVGGSVEKDFIQWCNAHDYTIAQTAGVLANVSEKSGLGEDTSNYLDLVDYHRNLPPADYMQVFGDRVKNLSRYSKQDTLTPAQCGVYFNDGVCKSAVNNNIGKLAEGYASDITPHTYRDYTSDIQHSAFQDTDLLGLQAQNRQLSFQNNTLSKNYDRLIETLKSKGDLPKNY